MSRRLTRRLTYSSVIATAALFMALGGVGYAAATVDSSSIVNNSVRGKDIHQRTIRGGDVRNIASTTAPTRMATPARTWLGSTRRPRRTGP
jgi:hypothetical protein